MDRAIALAVESSVTHCGAKGLTISGSPPTGVTSTGVPEAMDSTVISPNPSKAVVGTTVKSAAR